MSSVCSFPPRPLCPRSKKRQGIRALSPDADSFYENMAHRNLGNVTVALLKEERTQYRSQFFFALNKNYSSISLQYNSVA